MDDDPVLRALGDALERDDPLLAALLRAGPTPAARRVLAAPPQQPFPQRAAPPPASPAPQHRRRPPGWVLALGAVLTGVLIVLVSIPLGLAAFGVLGITLLVVSPLAACLWCATIDELRPPEGPTGR